MKGDMNKTCSAGACARCLGGLWLVIGIVLLINAYWPFAAPWTLVGYIAVVLGILKLIWPCCSHCK